MVLQTEELSFGCGEGGDIFGCAFCFNSAHAACCGFGDRRTKAPRGDWACPACIDHARSELRRLQSTEVSSSSSSDEEPVGLSVQEIKDPKTTVRHLKSELDRLGLSQSGRKRDLVNRLLDFHKQPRD